MQPTTEQTIVRQARIDPGAVSLAALRLFDEHGFDAVSMDDVAEAAGIGRRSLFRLFPSKAALVWGGLDEFATRFTEALRDRPADEPSPAALRAAYRIGASFPDDVSETTRLRLRVIRTTPELDRGREPARTSLIDVVRNFIAERDGLTVDDLTVMVRAHAIAAGAGAALTWWALHGDGRPEDAMDRALDGLGRG